MKSDSKKWIYRQYDQRVGLRTVQEAGHPVALVKLESDRMISIALGCRPWLMQQDPVMGGYDSIFEPAIKMVCTGSWPVAITDCLNFGNPEKPEIMSEFVASVEAIAHSAKLWDAPVISGNVSFYNETLHANIPSTPATGVVGLKKKESPWVGNSFTAEGLKVGLISLDEPGNFNPENIRNSAKSLFDLIEKGSLKSARLSTEKGLHHTLELMREKNFELVGATVSSQYKSLYQVVVAYDSSVENDIKNAFERFEILGTTKKMTSVFDLSERQNEFKKTWGVL